jgi:hypothetical protein
VAGPGYTGSVNDCQRPAETYPTRVPLKIIGRAAELQPEAVAALIFQQLRSIPVPVAWKEEVQFAERPNGQWISYTFWVTLPDEHAERPLREAIQQLPGVVMQL